MTPPKEITEHLRSQRGFDDTHRMSSANDFFRNSGLLEVSSVRASLDEAGAVQLFQRLVAAGRGDLSWGRLFEGHVNALQLIQRLGSAEQTARAAHVARSGGLLGIWGADDPADPGHLRPDNGQATLSGRKIFASGADRILLAVIAVKTAEAKTQLVLIDFEKLQGRFDPGWWHPIGMQATRSYALNLTGLNVSRNDLLGRPGDYEAQPFFGAGAIRFVAVQLGGVLAVWDATRDHLVHGSRYNNPHQAARLGEMVADVEANFCFVRDAFARVAPAISWDAGGGAPSDGLIADSARIAVGAAAERVIALAMRSVGCAGLMDDHPLAMAICDLLVYLRQPGPDAASVRFGAGAGSGSYQASFDER